jgi:peroxiredoxin
MKNLKLITALAACGLAFGVAGVVTASPDAAKPADKHAEKAKDKNKDEGKKGETAKVGEAAPAFTLKDLDGKAHNLSDFRGKTVVLEWFNPECPFVVKHHKTNKTFAELYENYQSKDVVFLAINSGAAGKQGNGVELNKKMKDEWKIQYPILVDEDGKVGRAFGAKTTPHMFVIDKDGKLVYAGAIDNNRDRSKAGDKNYVKNALDAVLAGKPVEESSTQPYGCSVKYAD